MGEYQRKNEWALPKAEWNATIWTIRCYYSYLEESTGMIGLKGVASDGQPHGSGTGDPTFAQAAERIQSWPCIMVTIIDDGLKLIPDEYRKGVWDNIQRRQRYPDDAARNTYGLWKQRFVVYVADRIRKIGHQGKNNVI